MKGNSSALLNVSLDMLSANSRLGIFPALSLHALLAAAIIPSFPLKARVQVKSQVISAVGLDFA